MPMIFQRKNKGRKANPRPTTFLTRFAEELRRAIAGEINFRRKVESRKANPGPTTFLTRFAEELPPSPRLRRTCRRAIAGEINFLLVKLLPTELFLLIGGELRIFSQLQISETDRSACQYVRSADVRERRYKSESNQARYGDHGIPQTPHEADGLCRMVVEAQFRSKDR